MKGTMSNYEDISTNIEIAPCMTNCFDVNGCRNVDSYEYCYAYYESEKSSSHPDRVFKAEFRPEAYK